MKIAIQHNRGSFSECWVEYCEKKNIPFKLVNCYESDIIEQLKDCKALMWHYHHADEKDILFAKGLLFSLEQAGVKVYPNFNTAWHFDDKIGQKYLLEVINAPLVPTHVFYDKTAALMWAAETTYPKVFKLRGGAGSKNVKLIKSHKQAKKLINKAFGKGFPLIDKWSYLQEFKYTKLSLFSALIYLMRGLKRGLFPNEKTKNIQNEKGYFYIQDFIPDNDSDLRIITVDKKAFGIKRMVRKGDFRASGSGNIHYEKSKIDLRCVTIAFEVSKVLQTQGLAFDFVFDEDSNPQIVEISYGFSVKAYDKCPGYWDESLNWNEGQFKPQDWMVESIIKTLS